MKSEHRIREIECMLRASAEQLDGLQPGPPWSQLHAGIARAQRRRSIPVALVVLVPAIALIVAVIGPAGRQASPDGSVAQPAETGSEAPAVAGSPSNRDLVSPEIMDATQRVPTADPAGADGAAAGSITSAGPIAVPIVIIHVEGGRESVVPGFLVPAHETPVNIGDLSPIEQRAIRRVLDLEADPYRSI